jgi:hypothetical protein
MRDQSISAIPKLIRAIASVTQFGGTRCAVVSIKSAANCDCPGEKRKVLLTYSWARAGEQTEDQTMPDWILAPICLVVLVGFIFYAFRQGTKVTPDRNNSDFGPSQSSGGSGSSDGGSGDGGGHSF